MCLVKTRTFNLKSNFVFFVRDIIIIVLNSFCRILEANIFNSRISHKNGYVLLIFIEILFKYFLTELRISSHYLKRYYVQYQIISCILLYLFMFSIVYGVYYGIYYYLLLLFIIFDGYK